MNHNEVFTINCTYNRQSTCARCPTAQTFLPTPVQLSHFARAHLSTPTLDSKFSHPFTPRFIIFFVFYFLFFCFLFFFLIGGGGQLAKNHKLSTLTSIEAEKSDSTGRSFYLVTPHLPTCLPAYLPTCLPAILPFCHSALLPFCPFALHTLHAYLPFCPSICLPGRSERGQHKSLSFCRLLPLP